MEGQLCSGTSIKLNDHIVNLSIKPKRLVHAENLSSPAVVEILRQCNINCRLVLSVHMLHAVI